MRNRGEDAYGGSEQSTSWNLCEAVWRLHRKIEARTLTVAPSKVQVGIYAKQS